MRVCVINLMVALFYILGYAEKTEPGLFFLPSAGLSWNPLGLLIDTRVLYTSPLVQKQGVLWESTKVRLGIQNEFTPADNLVSFRAECEPIAFFDVTVKGGFFGMFNGLGYGCYRMTSATLAYDPDAQKQGKLENAQGYWVSVSPTVKAKAGRIIVLNTLTYNRIAINGNGVYLELHSYLPHRTKDVDLINTTMALFENSAAMLTGLSFRNAYVYGTGRFSQALTAMAVVKSGPASPRKQYCAFSAGAYLQDPLYAGDIYVGCMAGWDFRIQPRTHRKGAKSAKEETDKRGFFRQ